MSRSLRDAQFHRDPLLGAGAHPLADVAAVDHEIAAIIGAPAHQDVDVRIVGVPVIDRDPVEPGAEILFHVGHQFAGEGPDIGKFGCVLGRDDEAEVMAIIGAAFGKGIAIDWDHRRCRTVRHPSRPG